MSGDPPSSPPATAATSPITIREPTIRDAGDVWRLAHRAGKLDANTSYAYILWTRDFASTSRVAVDAEHRLLGFVNGYQRPAAPDTIFVWQVAVAPEARGQGLGARLLDALLAQHVGESARWLEATITSDNVRSLTLFSRTAERWHAGIEMRAMFTSEDFPDAHEPEDLLRIGPLDLAHAPSDSIF